MCLGLPFELVSDSYYVDDMVVYWICIQVFHLNLSCIWPMNCRYSIKVLGALDMNTDLFHTKLYLAYKLLVQHRGTRCVRHEYRSLPYEIVSGL